MLRLLLLFIFPSLLFAYHCPNERSIIDAIQFEQQKLRVENQNSDGIQKQLSPMIKFFNQNLPWRIELQSGMMPPDNPNHVRFFQLKRNNSHLYCFYQWAGETGQMDNWMTLALMTSRTVLPSWQSSPYQCKSFFAKECSFHFPHNYW